MKAVRSACSRTAEGNSAYSQPTAQGDTKIDYLQNSIRYRQTGFLGRGTFGVVVSAIRRNAQPAHEVAIKLLERGQLFTNYHTYVLREIMHQGTLKHPFVVALQEVFLTPSHLAIVMEYARGGDLLHHTLSHYYRLLSRQELPNGSTALETHARWIFQQLIIGLDYCHKMGVANRDLKLDNLLLTQNMPDRPGLKIADFGYSKHDRSVARTTGVGTPSYMAPEIIFGRNQYDPKRADIWSCGVILYMQIYGRPPFDANQEGYRQKLYSGDFRLPSKVPTSNACKDLIQKMLVATPSQRIDIRGITSHPWFLEELPDGALNMNEHYLRASSRITDEDRSGLESRVATLVERARVEGRIGEDDMAVTFLGP